MRDLGSAPADSNMDAETSPTKLSQRSHHQRDCDSDDSDKAISPTKRQKLDEIYLEILKNEKIISTLETAQLGQISAQKRDKNKVKIEMLRSNQKRN